MANEEQEAFRAGKLCIDKILTIKQMCKKAWEKKRRVYAGFMNLEKVYDRVNRESLWQVLRMYDVGGKLLNRIKSMYVNSLAYVRVKGIESVSRSIVV